VFSLYEVMRLHFYYCLAIKVLLKSVAGSSGTEDRAMDYYLILICLKI